MPWPAELPIDVSGAGDSILIPAEADEIIEVWQFFLIVSSDTILIFKSDSTELTGPLPRPAMGGMVLDPVGHYRDPSRPWFTTGAGEAFVVNQTGAGTIGGRIYYSQIRPRNAPPP